MHSSAEQLEAVAQGLESSGGGQLSFNYDGRGGWTVMCVFGREAPDSPMAGGVAIGCGVTAADALEGALDEAGWHRLVKP